MPSLSVSFLLRSITTRFVIIPPMNKIGMKASVTSVNFQDPSNATMRPPTTETKAPSNIPSWGPVAWTDKSEMKSGLGSSARLSWRCSKRQIAETRRSNKFHRVNRRILSKILWPRRNRCNMSHKIIPVWLTSHQMLKRSHQANCRYNLSLQWAHMTCRLTVHTKRFVAATRDSDLSPRVFRAFYFYNLHPSQLKFRWPDLCISRRYHEKERQNTMPPTKYCQYRNIIGDSE